MTFGEKSLGENLWIDRVGGGRKCYRGAKFRPQRRREGGKVCGEMPWVKISWNLNIHVEFKNIYDHASNQRGWRSRKPLFKGSNVEKLVYIYIFTIHTANILRNHKTNNFVYSSFQKSTLNLFYSVNHKTNYSNDCFTFYKISQSFFFVRFVFYATMLYYIKI